MTMNGVLRKRNLAEDFFRFPSCREYNRGLHGRFNFLMNNRGFISRLGVPAVSCIYGMSPSSGYNWLLMSVTFL